MNYENLTSPNSIALILFGAVITFISANIIEYIKDRRERADKTRNFRLFIKLELAVIAKTLDKLQTALTYGSYYDYSLLDRVKESIDNLEKVRTDVIYLSDPELKERFIDVLSDVSTYITSVRAVQQLFYDDQNKASQSDKQITRTPKAVKTKKISKPNPIPGIQEVWDLFNKRMMQKTIEYVEIKRRLEELIKSLN